MDDYQDVSQGNEPMVIDVDTSNTVEFGPVPTKDYQLQCVRTEIKEGEGKSGKWKAIRLTLEIPSEPTADTFSAMEFIPLKRPEDTEKQYEKARSRFAKFKEAWGLSPRDTFVASDLEGRLAWAYVITKKSEEYGPQNDVRKWLVSRA